MKHQRAATATTAAKEAQQEKAQLHSEDYKPHLIELQGSRGATKVRQVEGLHELDHALLSSSRGELPANGGVGPEMRGDTSLTTGSSTFVDSNVRDEISR